MSGPNTSTVYLVGFGPGDPELLTLKAHRIIQEADIVFHDDLIHPDFVDTLKCPAVYVGKRKGSHYKKQSEINELLYKATQEYSKVVRLKGGDPFIFGRGGEELEYLQERNIPVEIVPGITSSMAAAASAKIPLTWRNISQSLTFLPAHHLQEEPIKIPPTGTLVLYMGASKIQQLAQLLISSGRPSSTSVALIQNASFPEEKVWYTNIEEMASLEVASPLVIIVGDVVGKALDPTYPRGQ
jgi:uroporphyrin-III C-methyltransferase